MEIIYPPGIMRRFGASLLSWHPAVHASAFFQVITEKKSRNSY